MAGQTGMFVSGLPCTKPTQRRKAALRGVLGAWRRPAAVPITSLGAPTRLADHAVAPGGAAVAEAANAPAPVGDSASHTMEFSSYWAGARCHRICGPKPSPLGGYVSDEENGAPNAAPCPAGLCVKSVAAQSL
jgi:hypothetical protein